jgi:hypothetical protein
MKLKRISSVVAAGMLAIVGIGLSGPAKASETSYTNLCVSDNGSYVCAYSQGAGIQILMISKATTGINTTNWYWPDTNTTDEIREADTTLCMQLDHDAGNIVIEAACNGAPYQYWHLTSSGEFISAWDASQCLTYNKDHTSLDTVTCNGAWYQSWWGPTT